MLKRLLETLGRLFAVRPMPRLARNSPCHCGSGRKYKRCCLTKDATTLRMARDQASSTLDEIIEGPAGVAERALKRVNQYRPPKPK